MSLLTAVAPSLIAGGMSLYGAKRATDEQQQFNSAQASLNRDFQERMSNTAYQRAAKDLEAAGLNRILALGSPASSPGGSTASMSLPGYQGAVSDAVNASSAVGTLQVQSEQKKQIKQATKNLEQQFKILKHDTTIREGEAAMNEVKRAIYKQFGTLLKAVPDDALAKAVVKTYNYLFGNHDIPPNEAAKKAADFFGETLKTLNIFRGE